MGYNSDVQHGDRRFHVQTEVVGRESINVRTTVLAGGVVLASESQPCPMDGGDPAVARAFVEAVHREAVGRVERGELGGR